MTYHAKKRAHSNIKWFYITNFVNVISSCYLGRRLMSIDLFVETNSTFMVLVDGQNYTIARDFQTSMVCHCPAIWKSAELSVRVSVLFLK